MHFRGIHLFALSLLFLSSGCLKDGEVLVDDLANVKAQVFKVENKSGKLVIEGKNLNATQKVRIKGNSIDNKMVIQSQSKTRIVAALSQAITLTASAVYELVLSNAYGQSVYQLSFEIQDGQVTTVKLADGAVTGDKISDMGALSGQILKYNGTTWSPADLNSLVYAGTWDASTGTEPDSAPVGGDFWIVDTDADVDLGDGNGVRQWRIGDWIVYNSFTGQWDQVISSQSVVSFNGRAGEVTPEADDYTWQQIDKTLAPIDDLTDVDTATTPPSNGEVLKWDGSNWIPQVDENDGGDITSVNAGTGLLGGATSGDADLDIDVGTSANQIPQLDGSGLLLNSIIPGLDTSKITSGTMNTARLPYASSTTDGIISSSDYQTFSGTDTTLSNGAAGEYLDGDGNWYVLDNAAVGLGNVTNDQQIPLANLNTNIALGTDDTLVPSQNAVKTYVDNSVSTASNDYLLRDGTQAMTGDFDGGANNLTNINNSEVGNELRFIDDGGTNYVALKSRPSVSTNQTWLLPASDGGAGQILSTDGSGNLSWASSGDGSVTDVTATLPVESSGGTTPDISMAQANSTTDGYLSSTDWSTFDGKEDALGTGAANQYLDENKTWQNLDTDAVTEGSNLYYTTARARADAVEDQIVDGVTNRAPSQNAVFDELATKADQASLSDYVLKDGDTMTGQLNLPADGLNIGSGQLTAIGGNVGIGTNSPLSVLDIGQTGNLTFSGSSSPGYTAAGGGIIDTPAGKSLFVEINGNEVGDRFSIVTDPDNTGGPDTESFVVRNSGSIGAGTISPTRPFHVYSADDHPGLFESSDARAFSSFKDNGTTGDNTVAVGALGDDLYFRSGGADNMVLTSTGNVGIGTTSPDQALEVNGATVVGASNFDSTLDGEGYFQANSDLAGNGFVATPWVYARAIEADQRGSSATMISLGSGNGYTSNDEIGFVTSGSERMRVLSNGRVGIGTTTPSTKLHVAGTITEDSDERLKDDIRTLDLSIEKLQQVRGVTYDWKDSEKYEKGRQMGVIAQEIKAVFPEAVKTSKNGYLSVSYSGLVAPLIEATKEQQKQIEKNRDLLKRMSQGKVDKNTRKIASLKSELITLKSELAEMRKESKKVEAENREIKTQNKEMKTFLCQKFSDASFCTP